MSWAAPARLRVSVLGAALAVAGCYAQNNTGRGGGGH
jgi:hypothetical protein